MTRPLASLVTALSPTPRKPSLPKVYSNPNLHDFTAAVRTGRTRFLLQVNRP